MKDTFSLSLYSFLECLGFFTNTYQVQEFKNEKGLIQGWHLSRRTDEMSVQKLLRPVCLHL